MLEMFVRSPDGDFISFRRLYRSDLRHGDATQPGRTQGTCFLDLIPCPPESKLKSRSDSESGAAATGTGQIGFIELSLFDICRARALWKHACLVHTQTGALSPL